MPNKEEGNVNRLFPFLVSERVKEYLTCLRRASSVAGAEEDARNNVGATESGKASCGMDGNSCMMIDVCWTIKLNQI